jgi:hypothetical protein
LLKVYFNGNKTVETSFKIEDLRPNKTTGKLSYDQQPEFRRLSEFYIIIFLNKLKILVLPCKISLGGPASAHLTKTMFFNIKYFLGPMMLVDSWMK